jgi:hypothetical protein
MLTTVSSNLLPVLEETLEFAEAQYQAHPTPALVPQIENLKSVIAIVQHL